MLYLKEETASIAARHEQPISEASSNVYVITDDDIRRSGPTNLPTVLLRIPGLEVMQVTGTDFNVSARGDNQLNANKLLVMVDGCSIYVDVQGSVYWKAIPVTLPEIKRIAVQIGPASVLYGFNAFDGIINIITKSPEEMKGAGSSVRISDRHRQSESDRERYLSNHHARRLDDDADQFLARCSKNLRSSFESFRTNGAVIECTGVFPVMLSPSRHTNRPYFAVEAFCSRSCGIPAGSIIVVPGPLALSAPPRQARLSRLTTTPFREPS